MKKIIIILFALGLLSSCMKSNKSDAYGNFEATEVIVSAESNGKILTYNINEGDKINKNTLVAVTDTISLYLQLQQSIATRSVIKTKIPNIISQIEILKEQKANLLIDQERIQNLHKEGAATKKQLDDINGSIKVVDKKISSIKTQNQTVFSELEQIDWQIAQIKDKLLKCKVKNPINGTVLTSYVEEGEFISMGKPLYKIADLDEIILRVYISGDQLSSFRIGQQLNVIIDGQENANTYKGKVSWISDEAEFTPKIIQTKEERVKLVYAVKIIVKNDGRLKIGMPAEVRF